MQDKAEAGGISNVRTKDREITDKRRIGKFITNYILIILSVAVILFNLFLVDMD